MLDWLLCNAVKRIGGFLCCLPPHMAIWLGERFGGLAYWLQPKRTQIGLINLRAAFDGKLTPEQARRIIHACYRQLGAGIFELLRLPVIDRAYVDRYVTLEGREHFEAAKASGRPIILLTGHYGSWELTSIVAAINGYPIMALARAQDKFPRLYRLLVSYRESKGCKIVHKGGAMKRLVAGLSSGQLIGIVGDQVSRQGVFVNFFGRPALFATGPFDLAYSREALILPAFIHRLHGPFHRLVIEPPIDLSRHRLKSNAVRDGVEQFAASLARHVHEDPGQWLWMHKRWKHTTARRALVLSDGKTGHLKQSLAVIDALRERCPNLTSEVIEIRYRSAMARAAALLWSWWVPNGAGGSWCLHWTLTREATAVLLRRYADVIVSCGSATVAVNLLWARANQAKSIVMMNPAPIPLRRFDLVVVPRHDRLPRRSNIVQTAGALASPMPEETLRQAAGRLRLHPKFRASTGTHERQPVIVLLVGGDTDQYELTTAFAEALIRGVTTVCDELRGACLVTTSRRTSAAIERLLAEQLGHYPRCRLLLIANQDPINGTMEGLLGSADVVVVTGESISMVSEACASGRRVVVVELPLRAGAAAAMTKHQRFLHGLIDEGHVRYTLVSEVGVAIRRALQGRQALKRLDNFAVVRDAVARLV